jgi:hypothetical protein
MEDHPMNVLVCHSPPHGDNHRGYHYLAFSADADWELAAERFEAKYGSPPQYIFTSKGLLLVGPIPDESQRPH